MPEKYDFSKIENQQKFEQLPQEEKEEIIGDAQEEMAEIHKKARALAGTDEKPTALNYSAVAEAMADKQAASEQIDNEKEKREIILTPEQEKTMEGVAIEEELSPEVIEKIMSKVKDINLKGQAVSRVIHHGITSEKIDADISDKIKSILKYGLLGTSVGELARDKWGNKVNKDIYVEAVKGRLHPDVFFNILGRLYDDYHQYGCDKISGFIGNAGALGVLFEIPPQFKEVVQVDRGELGRSTYSVWMASNKDKERFLNGYLPKTSPIYGFRLSHRVPPRFFQGLVFSTLIRELTVEEYEKLIAKLLEGKQDKKREENLLRQQNYRYIKEERPEKLIKYAAELARYMIDVNREGKENMLTPIYDADGNLWWPKQIKYEEIRKEFKERENEWSGEEK